MIKRIIEEPNSSNGLAFARVRTYFYPDKLDLSNWDGSRDQFSFMDHWCNAVAQKFYEDTHNGGDWFVELSESDRKIYYDRVASALSELDRSHWKDHNDRLSIEDYDDSYEGVKPILLKKFVD